MENIDMIVSLISQNSAGLILALIVYLYMRWKLNTERSSFSRKEKPATDEQIEHLKRLRKEFDDIYSDATGELSQAYRYGIIKGICYEKNASVRTVGAEYIFEAIDSIGSYNMTVPSSLGADFQNKYRQHFGYDESQCIQKRKSTNEYAYRAGIIQGVIYEYDRDGELCNDELIVEALCNNKDFYRIKKDKLAIRFIDQCIEKANQK